MPDCPSDADLSGFLNDALPADRAGAVSAHVDGCPACQARLGKLTDVTQAHQFKDLSTITSPGVRLGVAGKEPQPEATTQVVGVGEVIQGIRSRGALPAVPGFELLSELGRGGMGVVYKARHVRLNRLVALKMILAGGASDAKTVQRFLTEAEVLARVQHPQVVQVFEVDTFPGADGTPVPYLAMELLEGGTLSRRLRAGPLPPREAAELLEGVARAVHSTHLLGIVHRDLKPGNILFGVGGGQWAVDSTSNPSGLTSPSTAHHTLSTPAAKVSDFGLAKFTQGNSGADLTHTGQIVGTPAYMAPEQALGSRTLGPAADVYALGAILFECLSGRPPFAGGDPMSVLLQVVNDPAPDVRTVRPDAPRDLAAVALKCLEKEPKRRYASAGDLADDLRRYLTNRPTLARPATRWERAYLWTKRNPKETILLVALGVVVATAFVLVSGQLARAEQNAADEHRALEQAEQARAATADALGEARRQKAIAEQREARLAFAQAVDWSEEGQVDHGLGQFVRALELAEATGDAGLARVVRVNLAAWAAELPPPARAFPHATEPRLTAFTPDGKRMVTAGRGAAVHLWDADAGARLRTYDTGLLLVRPGRSAFAFWTVAVGPDAKTVAAGGEDGQVWVWDIDRSEPRTAFTAAAGDVGVSTVAFAPDGTLWAADGAGGAKRWDLTTRRAVAGLKPPGDRPAPVAVLLASADGRRVFTGDRAGVVRQWDAAAGTVTREWKTGGEVRDLALSPTEGELAATGDGGFARVFDLGSGAEVYRAGLDGATGNGVTFLLGRPGLLATADGDGTMRTWDRGTGLPVGVASRFRGEVSRLRARPGTDQVAVPAGDTVFLYRAAGLARVSLAVGTPTRIRGLDVSPDGKRTAVDAGDRLDVCDTRTGARAASFPLPGDGFAVRFDPTRSRLLRGTAGGLEAVELPGGRRVAGTPAAGPAREAVLTPDGTAVLTHSGLAVSRWDAAALTLLKTQAAGLKLPPGQVVAALALRPDGTEALVAFGNRVAFLDPATLEPTRPGWDTADEVLDARYTPDGARVVAGLRNNSSVVLAAADGTPVLPPSRHTRAVTSVGVGAGGALLVTGSRSGNARFWDAATGLELGPPLRHPGPVVAVAFSPAGDRVATGTSTGHAFTWPLPPPPLGGSLDEVRATVREWTGRVHSTRAGGP